MLVNKLIGLDVLYIERDKGIHKHILQYLYMILYISIKGQ